MVLMAMRQVRRLGLREGTERVVRSANTVPGAEDGSMHSTGMLVVESVVPGSPADGVLEAGDVLIRLNGQVGPSGANALPCMHFARVVYESICAHA